MRLDCDAECALGVLSRQSALNEYAYREGQAGLGAEPAPLLLGIPFPVPAYEVNTYYAFAGNLIGLVVVFSFLIPVSTMLRALVLEKEEKLREQLLTMGATLPAYYGSVRTCYHPLPPSHHPLASPFLSPLAGVLRLGAHRVRAELLPTTPWPHPLPTIPCRRCAPRTG